ncbi:MAG: RNA polymerase sigma-70 factor [Marivirga sp.]|nr:RNA polymerase sigma-70 factor [Marivirga sp.]
MLDSERDIINAIREGNTFAFQQVFNANYQALCQYSFTILKDSAEVQDIVQSVFLKIWEKRNELEIKLSIRSYLFKAVYHQCMNQLEHRTVKLKHRVYSNYTQTVTQPPETFPLELEENITAAINGLPEQCRIIFMMSRYDEMRYAEIAEQLKISVNTVENQISKALKILRSRLKDI